jgi:hypothetical protein
LKVILQTNKNGSIPNVDDLTLRQRTAIQRWVSAIDLLNVGAQHVGQIFKDDFFALFASLDNVKFPHHLPPTRQAFGVRLRCLSVLLLEAASTFSSVNNNRSVMNVFANVVVVNGVF